MYTSTKPTIYLIDGLNLVRSFLYEFARSEDGTFRPVGPLYRAGVHISFAEENSADQIIYERASYLSQTNQRVIAVTDDRALQEDLKALGVKTQFCRKFYNSFKPSEK